MSRSRKNKPGEHVRTRSRAQTVKHGRAKSKALEHTLVRRQSIMESKDEKLSNITNLCALVGMTPSDLIPKLDEYKLKLPIAQNASHTISFITDPHAKMLNWELQKILEKDMNVENFVFLLEGLGNLYKQQNDPEHFLNQLKAITNTYLLNKSGSATGVVNAGKSKSLLVNLSFSNMQNLRKAIKKFADLSLQTDFNAEQKAALKQDLLNLKKALADATDEVYQHLRKAYETKPDYLRHLAQAEELTILTQDFLNNKDIKVKTSNQSSLFTTIPKNIDTMRLVFFNSIRDLLTERLDMPNFKAKLKAVFKDNAKVITILKGYSDSFYKSYKTLKNAIYASEVEIKEINNTVNQPK